MLTEANTCRKYVRRKLQGAGWDNGPHSVTGRRSAGFVLLNSAFLRPTRLVKLEITGLKDSDWTQADKIKLSQDGLFDSQEIKKRAPLRKIPFDFHYHYESGGKVERHKLVDWEAGALYWHCFDAYGTVGWEAKFRQRLETEFAQKDLLFLMGTIHRFPDQWLIVGFVYPPKQPPIRDAQLGLQLDR